MVMEKLRKWCCISARIIKYTFNNTVKKIRALQTCRLLTRAFPRTCRSHPVRTPLSKTDPFLLELKPNIEIEKRQALRPAAAAAALSRGRRRDRFSPAAAAAAPPPPRRTRAPALPPLLGRVAAFMTESCHFSLTFIRPR